MPEFALPEEHPSPLAAAQAEVQQLRRRLDAAEQGMTALRDENERMRNANERLRNGKRNADAARRETDAKLQTTRTELLEVLGRKRERIERQEAEIARLTHRIDGLVADMTRLRALVPTLAPVTLMRYVDGAGWQFDDGDMTDGVCGVVVPVDLGAWEPRTLDPALDAIETVPIEEGSTLRDATRTVLQAALTAIALRDA
jgi:hypothetical protein